MNNTTFEYFFKLTRMSLYNQDDKFNENEIINLENIFYLANIHNMTPIIYNSARKLDIFNKTSNEFESFIKRKSIQIIYSQIQRSERFLQLYRKFNESNINVLVFKGIILRELYPNPDERISSDEDLLIKKENLEKCISILEDNQFERVLSNEDDADVYHYFCKRTGLHLELHTSLFGNKSKAYGHMNEVFLDVFSDSDTININNVEVSTFSMDKHFLYVICHAIKHFISSGTGIRQICDITMYINKYYNIINWYYIWNEMSILGYDTLFVNLLQISIDYLGLDENKIKYNKNKENYYINIENLVEDIMDAGVYGKSNQERLNSANMSLKAMEKESEHESKLKSNLAAIFPSRDALKDRYKYLDKYPVLLPVAWGSRILSYSKDKGSLSDISKSAKETIMVGNRRIDLLKEYMLLK